MILSKRFYPGSIKPPGNFPKPPSSNNFPKPTNTLINSQAFGPFATKQTSSPMPKLQAYIRPQPLFNKEESLTEKYKNCQPQTVVSKNLTLPESSVKPFETAFNNTTTIPISKTSSTPQSTVTTTTISESTGISSTPQNARSQFPTPNTPQPLLITDGREDAAYVASKVAQQRPREIALERAKQAASIPSDGSVMYANPNGEIYRISTLLPLPPKLLTTSPITDDKHNSSSQHISEAGTLTTSITENTSSSPSIFVWDDMLDFTITPVGLITTANVLIQDPTKNVLTNDKLLELTKEREDILKEPAIKQYKLITLFKCGLAKVEDHEKKHNFGLHKDYQVDPKYIYTDYTLTGPFYKFLSNMPVGYDYKILLNVTQEEFNGILKKFTPKVGFLTIEEKLTKFPSGMQSHVVLYHPIKTTLVAFGYFTSKTEDNILLTSYQPFHSTSTKKSQMLHILKVPFIISSSHIEPAEGRNLTKDIIYLRQKTLSVGNKYLEMPNVHDIIKQEFGSKVLPKLFEEIPVYNEVGVTENHIDTAINNCDINNKQEATRIFESKYINRIKQILAAEKSQKLSVTQKEKEIASIKIELGRWMAGNEKNKPQLFPYIKELVNEYNKKNNIDQRYE